MKPVMTDPTLEPAESSPRTIRTKRELVSAADRHLWEIAPIRDLLWLATGIGVLWGIYALRSVFVPIFIAGILAYLANPLIRRAERRWKVTRPLTVSVLLFLFSFIAAGFLIGVGPLMSDQVGTLTQKVPSYIATLSNRFGALGSFSSHVDGIIESLKADPFSFVRPFLVGTGQAFGLLGTMIGATRDLALALFLIPLYFFFMGWHFDRMLANLSRFIPVSRQERTFTVLRRMDAAVSGFFHERLLIAVITGTIYAIGWAITDVPYWFILGIGMGFLSLIPYISVIGWPLAVLFKYLDSLSDVPQMDWLAIFVWPSVAYVVVQFIESWILTPWIQRGSSDMSAITLLIVMFIGGAVGGLFGLVFAIPIAACIKILFEEFVVPSWTHWAARQ